ncbi:uncharacterized protein B0I36DRAFT_332031 [Microdochium trichocladiopsis]|uniref:HRQ family protein 2 n=1 Tax=Microdochium trichocladiopsis TaxID=1682393 RepID=A0A9P8XY98_9PEZI|nr:uncharacterized protein B0I36DRAFT_332031 [Microdochium trichocladiopsis]KAH7024784.1 hypothetical protein B0I36DRAFT_332031 [Microdochium trichocladiopsis]
MFKAESQAALVHVSHSQDLTTPPESLERAPDKNQCSFRIALMLKDRLDSFVALAHTRLILPLCVISILGIATAMRRVWKKRSVGRGPVLAPEKDALEDKKDTADLGTITPLTDYDYLHAEPRRVYKFQPKFFMTMGLQSTDINHILHIDSDYLERLQARRNVAAIRPEVLACLPRGLPAVHEFYNYLVHQWLPGRYPTIFTLFPERQTLENTVTGEHLPLTPPADGRQTLEILNRNLDDDVLFMTPRSDNEEDGLALNALMWCFPNTSDPRQRLGGSLREVHQRVPGYKEKLGMSMDRYFRRLQVGRVVCRTNWAVSIKASQTESQLTDKDYRGSAPTEIDPAKIYLRCELQTLFRLPVSGARVFIIHEYVYPLQQIKDEGLGPAMIQSIDGLKEGNVPAIWDYKEAPKWAEAVKQFLST